MLSTQKENVSHSRDKSYDPGDTNPENTQMFAPAASARTFKAVHMHFAYILLSLQSG